MNGNLYIILGVSESAREGEIKKAYRRLARKYHPDINPGDRRAEERFRRISEAYEILSDPEKRGFYDENGYFVEGAFEQRTATWEFAFSASDGTGVRASDFSEVFDGFLHRPGAEEPAETDGDIETHLSVTFDQSIRGTETHVEVYRKRLCPSCEGTGQSHGTGEYDCPDCGGSGRFVKSKGHLQFSMTCPRCVGRGRMRSICPSCGGEGRTGARERVPVTIPAGVNTGSRVRIPGEGNVEPKSRRSGDLYVVTNVGSHPFFHRAGDNIHCQVPVTISEAALGGKIEVPTIDGSAVLRVPPGIETGRTLRLRGKGAPSLRGSGVRGDQYVELRVVVPRFVDERSRELLRELARLNPDNPREGLPRYGR
jgi:molecular chaperone DnaJ